MALGGHAVDCTAFDADLPALVDLGNLILGVSHALYGCPDAELPGKLFRPARSSGSR